MVVPLVFLDSRLAGQELLIQQCTQFRTIIATASQTFAQSYIITIPLPETIYDVKSMEYIVYESMLRFQ